MENTNKPVQSRLTFDETKIYTPRLQTQMRFTEPPCVFIDHAPVRIYERPLKKEVPPVPPSGGVSF